MVPGPVLQRTRQSEHGFAEESVNNTSDMARRRRNAVTHGDEGWHESSDGMKMICAVV